MNLHWRKVDLNLTHSWRTARSSAESGVTVIIVELTDSNRVIGLGEAAPVARYNESPASVEAFLRKVDPNQLSLDDIPATLNYMDGLSPGDPSAKCAVEVALVDAAARRSRVAVYDSLGIGFRERHHVTSFTIGIADPELFQTKVAEAEQYPVLKMKVGSPNDRLNLQRLREIAPDKPIRADANEAWPTKEIALKEIEWLASDKHVEFVEQPMPATTPTAEWEWLRKRSPLPIFGDESYHTSADAARAAECFHGINVKLVKAGGIMRAAKALQAARALGLQTMIGCMIESSVLISAAAQLAELCDYLDLDGNLLIDNDPFRGVTALRGVLSFESALEQFGLRVSPR